MKKVLSFCMIFCSLCMLPFTLKAQTPNTCPIPNGDFENWSAAAGYGLQIPYMGMTFNVPIFNGFSSPDSWGFPSLPINQDVDLGAYGTVHVSTNVPLILVSQDSNQVPQGNSALMLRSFKISDIMASAMVYNAIASSLDSTLTNMVIPSLLTSGTIHVENFFTLLNNIMDNLDSVNYLAAFEGLDMNDYISGGIALNNGFIPGKVSGMYKYVPSTSLGDNGAIMLLGTRYDTDLQKRVVVGGGLTLDLTTTSPYVYEPFEVRYHYGSELDSSIAHLDPDTLNILILSSASNNIQQYSTLFVDGMTLWEADSNDVENSCSRAYWITLSEVDTTSAHLMWWDQNIPNYWEVEYGLQDFVLGTGIQTTTSTTQIELDDLQPDTYYDVYVRGVCDDGYSIWSDFRFKTAAPGTPSGIQDLDNSGVVIYPNPAHGSCSIQFNKEQPSNVKLYSIDGKLLQSFVPNDNNISLSLPYRGVFMLRCETANGILTQKIVNF